MNAKQKDVSSSGGTSSNMIQEDLDRVSTLRRTRWTRSDFNEWLYMYEELGGNCDSFEDVWNLWLQYLNPQLMIRAEQT
jgi:hypothetical protein